IASCVPFGNHEQLRYDTGELSVTPLTNRRSTEGSGAHVVQDMWRANLVLGTPETELLRPSCGLEATSADHEKSRRARREHAQLPEITQSTDHRPPALADDALGRDWSDAGHPQQRRARRGTNLHRKPLRMRERPSHLWIERQRQITGIVE